MGKVEDEKITELTGKFAKFEERENERRRRPFTDEEVAAIRAQLLNSVYADIGKAAVKKLLQFAGAVFGASLVALTVSGNIKWGG
jgi:hypothetical protein